MQFFDKCLVAQVDLTAQVFPNAGLVLALGDEADVAPSCLGALGGKLREEPAGLKRLTPISHVITM